MSFKRKTNLFLPVYIDAGVVEQFSQQILSVLNVSTDVDEIRLVADVFRVTASIGNGQEQSSKTILVFKF